MGRVILCGKRGVELQRGLSTGALGNSVDLWRTGGGREPAKRTKGSGRRGPVLVEVFEKALNELVEVPVGASHGFHLPDGMNDRGVMFSTEAFTDVG